MYKIGNTPAELIIKEKETTQVDGFWQPSIGQLPSKLLTK